MKHQKEYPRRLRKRPKTPANTDVMALLGEMGVGKSKMILDEWQEGINDDIYDNLLVISRSGSYKNWYEGKTEDQRSELETHLDPRLYKKMLVCPWVTGSKRALDKIAFSIKTQGRPRAMFISFEAISTSKKAVAAMIAFIKSGRTMSVVDESPGIKNARAARSKVILKQVKPISVARRIMTGLISPRSPLDIFWQYWFLDKRILGFETMAGFKNHYAVVNKKCYLHGDVIRAKLLTSMGIRNGTSTFPEHVLKKKLKIVREHLDQDAGAVTNLKRDVVIRKLIEEAEVMRRDDMIDVVQKLGGYIQIVEQIKEYKNLEELEQKTAPYKFRVLKKDCLDLKPKIYMPIYEIEMTEEQKRLYGEMKTKATAELETGDHVVATAVISQMIRLHQIVCGHVKDENGVVHDVPSNRIQAVLDILEEHSGKAIIWATYQREIEKIAEALREVYGPRSVARFYGGNKKTRGQEEKNFLSNPECRFMVSTQSAGGVGNTWNVANLTIYAANSYDLELRLQSEDRNHRKGQHNSVTYVDICCPNTVEGKILYSLRNKIDLFTIVNGENYLEWLI
jgi:hypothetical protein